MEESDSEKEMKEEEAEQIEVGREKKKSFASHTDIHTHTDIPS
jgi:hypothetical protein